MSNIKQIAQAALTDIDNVLNNWCAGGKRHGHEYVTLNPTRSDSKAGSFSINLNSGAWSDFATGDKGGDLVALVAYLDNVSMGEAAKRLSQFLGINTDKTDAQNRAKTHQNKQGNTSTSTKPSNPPAHNASKSDDGFVCVMPVPSNAPKPPATHSRHGKPSKRYAYLTIDGLVNFYHDRYEAKGNGERKQFAPLTYWHNQATNKSEWRFKAPPANRPLYGLPHLNTLKSADVWIVEGEKAADALSTLMSSNPVITWQGGAQAVAKADFNPLTGRNCIIWRDKDEAGLKAAQDVCKSLAGAEALSVKMVDIEALANTTLVAGYEMQTGDDAADLLNAGFTSERLIELMALDGVIVDAGKQKADQVPLSANVPSEEKVPAKIQTYKRHFQVLDEGVFVVDVTRERDAYQAPKWICDKLEVLARSRSPFNGEWGKLISFKDPDNVQHRFIIPARSFNGEGLEATGLLYENGLNIANKARPLVLEYLQQENPEQRARVTNKTGWHGEGDEAVFVLPQGAIGDASEEWIFDTLQPSTSAFKQKGTVESWRDNVASLCVGNSRLVFAVSISFAAPLRKLLDIKDLGGFHFRGASSDGKSTALRLAGSVCGGSDYVKSWKNTASASEGTALAHSDAPLFLDELKMMDAKEVGETVYMLANGQGKGRSLVSGDLRQTKTWRILFLSAGELSLAQHMLDANKKVHAGQEIRMADIPADAGAGLGVFENLHGYSNGNEFAKAIASEINQHYGVAFPAFIAWVLRDKQGVIDKLHKAQQGFDSGLLSASASGQARRVASIFALVGAAGELATQAGLTGWQQGEAFKAAKTCFQAWLAGFGGEGNQEQRAMLSQVRSFLELHGEGRFADLNRNAIDDDHAARVMAKAGYRKHDKVAISTEYYVYPEVFKTEICKGLDHKAVVQLLVDKGYMHKGDKDHAGQPKRDLPEGKRRVFHVYGSIFGDDNE